MKETPAVVGSQREVERVYRATGARLWRAVLLFAGDAEVASDAVAEAFSQVLRRGDAVRSVEGWVWRTAFRVAAGLLKERRRMSSYLPESSYEMPEDTADLVEALRALSPRQRAAVVLHYYGGYPMKEVAALLGSTPSAVGVHLHRARRRLRTLIGDADA